MGRKSGNSKGRSKATKDGKAIIQQAISEAKEVLEQYKMAKQMEEELNGGGEGGGKGFDKMEALGKVGEGLAETFGRGAATAMAIGGGLIAGFVMGALESSNNYDFNNRYGQKTPTNLSDDEREVYQEALINAFGFTAFQIGDWQNWVPVDDYVSSGGFQDGDKGGSIKGLLQDGDYHKC
jgi:hypothetical protein